jgi:hypothetical protein
MRALPAAMLLLITTPTLIRCGSEVNPNAEGAVKVIQAVGADANKLKIFCELMDVDEKLQDRQDPVLQSQLDKLLDRLGADFKEAWGVVSDTDEKSSDGKALIAALNQLEDKCP